MRATSKGWWWRQPIGPESHVHRGRRRARPRRKGRAVHRRRWSLLADPPARNEAGRRAHHRCRQGRLPALATGGGAARVPTDRQEPGGGAAGPGRLQAIPLAPGDRGAGRPDDGAGPGADRPRSASRPAPSRPLPARVGDPVWPLLEGREGGGRGWAAKAKSNRQSTPAQKSQAAFVRHELADAAKFPTLRSRRPWPRRRDSTRKRRRWPPGSADTRRRAGPLEEGGRRRLSELAVRTGAGGLPPVLAQIDKKGRSRPLGSGLDRRGPGRTAAGLHATGSGGGAPFPARRRGVPRRAQIYTREQFPKEWASAENDSGPSSTTKAKLATGKRSARDPGAARRGRGGPGLALEVFTREQQPEAWAATSANLSRVLVDQAKLTPVQGGRAAGARRRHAEVDAGSADGRSFSQRVGGDRARAGGHPAIAGRARARRQG